MLSRRSPSLALFTLTLVGLADGVSPAIESRGSVGYYGPRPSVGDAPHRYYFQVLALDTVLNVPPGADRDQILSASRGHVLAVGQVIGRYAQQQRPLK